MKAKGNEVRLCSNSRRGNYAERLAALSAQLDVGVCPVVFRKPSTLALSGLDRKGRALVVVGDKDLTDGLLARRVGAQFIKYAASSTPPTGFRPKMANLIDNVFGPVALILWTRSARIVERYQSAPMNFGAPGSADSIAARRFGPVP